MKGKLFLMLLMACVVPMLTGCWDTGSGEKIGTIIKLNKQGVFYKTWEAEIIRGGINNGSGVMGQSFHFTIENDSMAQEVERYMNAQQEVKISYNMEAATWCRSDSQSHFLSKIEPLSIVSTPPVQSKELATLGSSSNAEIAQLIKKQQELLEQNQMLIKKLVGQ